MRLISFQKYTNHHSPEVSLLQNNTKLTAPSIDIIILIKAVKKEKKAAAPLLAVMFLPNIIQPLASAKSATDHMK